MRILEDELVDRIIDEAKTVLERTGTLIEDPDSFQLARSAGLPGDDSTKRITYPREIVDQAIASAPSSITLFDRDGEPHARLEGDEVHFVPASSALQVLDHRTQQVRAPKTADLIEYLKVGDGLQHVSYLSTAITTDDVPQDIADAWRLYVCLSHTKRPIVSGAFTAWGVERMARLMEPFRSGKDGLREKPLAIFTCCPNTPLRWGEDPVHNIRDCAEWGIPIEVVPVLLLGMISPVTTVGALVLHTAEVLSGLTLAQCFRPGTPVLFGGAPAAFHMQLMTNPMTSVEALQLYCGYAQIADRLELPSQAYMSLSDSKHNDPQAGAESGIGAMLAGLCGINSVSGPGMLDFVNCFSLEKLVFDDELVGHVKHFLRPVEVKDDLPTGPLIDELLADNHLLTSEHTLERWPTELYLPGSLVDRTNREQWEMQGELTLPDRAQEKIAELLDDYETEPVDEAYHAEVRDLLTSTCHTEGVELPAFDS